MIATWIINNDILALYSPDSGDVYTLQAEQIYSFFYEDKKIAIDNIELEISKDNCPVAISRFPVIISLVLELSNKIDDFLVSGKFLLKIKSNTKNVEDIISRGVDHIIINETWYPFPKNVFHDITELVSQLSQGLFEQLSLADYLKIIDKREDLSFKIIDHLGDSIFSSNIELPKYHPGEYFEGDLYQYQLRGYRWLKLIKQQGIGCVLADEMGLGKTIQIIALLADERNSTSLIIAPASLLENWRREFLKFSPQLGTIIHRGGSRTGFPSKLNNYDIVITSYGTAVRDRYMLGIIDWNIIVLDEAQAIKNPEALRTAEIKNFKKKCGIAVTGTPLENRLTDLWSLIDFTNHNMLGSLNRFNEIYEDTSSSSAKKLEETISPILLRRLVSQVAKDLPEKIEIPQFIEMHKFAIQDYESLRLQIKEEYGPKASLVALTKLRQFCCHPLVLSDTDIDKADLRKNSLKFQRLIEILEEIILQREKAIIFTSYSNMIDLLLEDIKSRFGIYCRSIDGRVAVELRQSIVDEFNINKESGCLILNPRAAGTGLNITGANHVIHYNPEWNPAIEDQATARAYRRGQTRPVTVHRLIYAGTVEEVMNERLELKRHLADLAVVGTQATPDEMADLIKALTISPENV
jgi:SNF2 family DNA or RNA helicase